MNFFFFFFKRLNNSKNWQVSSVESIRKNPSRGAFSVGNIHVSEGIKLRVLDPEDWH